MSRRTGEKRATAPVFLIGAPRSGTSLLYKSLALHEGFGYISNYNERAAPVVGGRGAEPAARRALPGPPDRLVRR